MLTDEAGTISNLARSSRVCHGSDAGYEDCNQSLTSASVDGSYRSVASEGKYREDKCQAEPLGEGPTCKVASVAEAAGRKRKAIGNSFGKECNTRQAKVIAPYWARRR